MPLFDERFVRQLALLRLHVGSLRGDVTGGSHLSRRRLPAIVSSDYRPYTRGDDLRYVDWNAYARHNDLLLKLGETEQGIDVHLLIDISRSMAWGEPSKLRMSQRLIAALGYLALTEGDRLKITPFAAGMGLPFGPVQGKSRLIHMLRYMNGLSGQSQTNIASILQTYARQNPRGGLLVICSDLLSADNLEEGLRILLPPRWRVVVLHMLSPQELRPQAVGTVELVDSETKQILPMTLDEPTVLYYRRKLATWMDSISKICARHGATYAHVSTAWSLDRKVIPYLRARRLFM